MLVCSLSSGSRGNCALVSDGRTHILVDAGISARRVAAELRAFDLTPADLHGVLVTHEHGDHIAGLARLNLPVYASPGTCAALEGRVSSLTPVGSSFEIGTLGVSAFPTPHDTPESLGFLVHMGTFRAAVCTDLGYMPDEALNHLCSAHYLLLEANHDVELLRRGPYPPFLKDRILGRLGHLSNDACAAVAAACARFGVRRITLCHLSDENNSPDLALGVVSERLFNMGAVPGRDVLLDVALQGRAAIPFTECVC